MASKLKFPFKYLIDFKTANQRASVCWRGGLNRLINYEKNLFLIESSKESAINKTLPYLKSGTWDLETLMEPKTRDFGLISEVRPGTQDSGP